MKTPDYVITENHSYPQGSGEAKIVEAGTFVRPIEIQYVPKHVLEDDRWRWIKHGDVVFCYFRGGIIPFPRKILRSI